MHCKINCIMTLSLISYVHTVISSSKHVKVDPLSSDTDGKSCPPFLVFQLLS